MTPTSNGHRGKENKGRLISLSFRVSVCILFAPPSLICAQLRSMDHGLNTHHSLSHCSLTDPGILLVAVLARDRPEISVTLDEQWTWVLELARATPTLTAIE